MKTAVIVFPGSNCDRDMQVALREVSGREPLMVWHREVDFPKVDLIAVPGGFSYGDYLRSGAMAANSPVMRKVVDYANAGVKVLGVCNGFQIITEAGLLPGVLMRNRDLKFICKDVYLKVENNQTAFTSRYTKGQAIKIPVAHHDGSYFANAETLAKIEGNGQVAFRYCSPQGEVSEAYNPNGSLNNIAGVLNDKGNVLGMMPHPERMISPSLGGEDGVAMFTSLLDSFA